MDRLPPHDPISEISCLATAIYSNNARHKILKLDEDDFYFHAHQLIFSAIRKLYDCGEEISIVSIRQKLIESGVMDKQVNMNLLMDIARNNLPATDNTIDVVKKLSRRRKIILMSHDTITKAHNLNYDVDVIGDEVETDMRDISTSTVENLKKINQVLPDDISKFDMTGKFVTSGIESVDRKIGGFFDTQLIIIGGRPGMGKTTYALQTAMQNSREKNILFITLEMLAAQLLLRAISAESEIPVIKIRTGKYDEREKAKLNDCMARVKKKYNSIMFIEKEHVLRRILGSIRKAHLYRPIGTVIIDYLQLISGVKAERRDLEVGYITRGFKNLALELEIPVILLSQLSRRAEGRPPNLDDLRESGNIEQDADMVLFLYQEDKLKEKTDLIVAKHRDGGIGIVPLIYFKKFYKFVGVADNTFDFGEE
jgi:replicative DNA helicase